MSHSFQPIKFYYVYSSILINIIRFIVTVIVLLFQRMLETRIILLTLTLFAVSCIFVKIRNTKIKLETFTMTMSPKKTRFEKINIRIFSTYAVYSFTIYTKHIEEHFYLEFDLIREITIEKMLFRTYQDRQ